MSAGIALARSHGAAIFASNREARTWRTSSRAFAGAIRRATSNGLARALGLKAASPLCTSFDWLHHRGQPSADVYLQDRVFRDRVDGVAMVFAVVVEVKAALYPAIPAVCRVQF